MQQQLHTKLKVLFHIQKNYLFPCPESDWSPQSTGSVTQPSQTTTSMSNYGDLQSSHFHGTPQWEVLLRVPFAPLLFQFKHFPQKKLRSDSQPTSYASCKISFSGTYLPNECWINDMSKSLHTKLNLKNCCFKKTWEADNLKYKGPTKCIQGPGR